MRKICPLFEPFCSKLRFVNRNRVRRDSPEQSIERSGVGWYFSRKLRGSQLLTLDRKLVTLEFLVAELTGVDIVVYTQGQPPLNGLRAEMFYISIGNYGCRGLTVGALVKTI